MSQNRLSALYICFAVLVSLWFAGNAPSRITDAALMYDFSQNAKIAYYLVNTGTYTSSKKEPHNPSKAMKREPIPVLAISAFLLLHPNFDARYKTVDLEEGRLTRTVKLVNVFWEFLAALFIFLLCLELFPNPIIAGVGALLALAISAMTFLSTTEVVDALYTELPATALLLATAWCAVRFVRHETKWRAISFGVALGLLALTKPRFSPSALRSSCSSCCSTDANLFAGTMLHRGSLERGMPRSCSRSSRRWRRGWYAMRSASAARR